MSMAQTQSHDMTGDNIMNDPLNRTFLWESEMKKFWETLGFNQHHINILINLGHGKYSDPKFLSTVDINKFAEYSLERCNHLRYPSKTQRHLQNIQKLFPSMILNKAIYYNPYFLTLTLPTMEKRKMDLIDLIATHLSRETNANKYSHLFFNEQTLKAWNEQNKDNQNGEHLSKADIIDLMDWDKIFENVSVLLTKDFSEIIKQIHVLKKLLCLEYTNGMGLSQIEFIELFEVYPHILRLDYFSFFSKFRFFVQFASAGILRKKRHFYNDNIDLTMIGNESKYAHELSFGSYESMLADDRVCSGYQIVLQYMVSMGWVFNYSWSRLSRLKYWNYSPELRKKYSIKEIIKMKPMHFVNVSDVCWKDYCHKTKKYDSFNKSLDVNWRDDHVDRYMDYEEFMKSELRPQMEVIMQWDHKSADEVKALLKKNKAKLRKPFLDKYEKNKQQKKEEEELLLDEEELMSNKRSSILDEKTYTLVEKEERKKYLNKMQKLEQLHSKLCRTMYAVNSREIQNFLRNPTDFGFNYQLKKGNENESRIPDTANEEVASNSIDFSDETFHPTYEEF